MRVTALVTAGGKGTRMKSEEEKPLRRVSGKGADCKYLISSLQIMAVRHTFWPTWMLSFNARAVSLTYPCNI